MNTIKIAIADDHKILRQGLVGIIKYHTDLELVFEAADGKELMEALPQCQPEVVLVDIQMPVMNGFQTTEAIKKDFRHIKVLGLSMHDDEMYIIKMLQAGAKGYLLKSAEPDEIVNAIRMVHNRNYYFNEQVSVAMLKEILTDEKIDIGLEELPVKLMTREKQVLDLICLEFTTQQIADQLFLSPRTVEGYRLKLLEKTHTKTTIGLVIYAIKNKMVEI
ncbi:MAG: response regulator transcription factor [Verrucomicrobia bacterium]|nr:response regulator transcription factor [Cytophagales bacterium]